MAQTFKESSFDYRRIERALEFLEGTFRRQPTLEEIAASVHLSEYHFQRLFSRWVGISPKRFLQYLTKEYAKELLKKSINLLDVTYETGLSSPGRLHDLFVTCEAVTPGEFKNCGFELSIEYGFHPTPFGECLLAVTERGICWLDFISNSDGEKQLARLKKNWQNAQFRESPARTARLVEQIFTSTDRCQDVPFHVFLKGTNFQIKVWEALLRVPYAHVVSYEDIAVLIRKPKAVRAVANAIGRNPVPFLIPCHRVIRKLGEWGDYGGGRSRKQAILGWEAATKAKLSETISPVIG